MLYGIERNVMELTYAHEDPEPSNFVSDNEFDQMSATEERVFQALIKHDLLVFPKPLAGLGNQAIHRASCFLVITTMRRCGIFEIRDANTPNAGSQYEERQHVIIKQGVDEYQIYEADHRKNDIEQVISDFVNQLKKSEGKVTTVECLWHVD